MPDNPNTGTFIEGAAKKDEKGRSYVDWPDGSRFYLRPQAGSPEWFRGSNGGAFHNPDNWNPKTGQWDPGGVNWASVGEWLGLGAIGGSALAVAALSSSVPAAVASNVGASTGGSGALASSATVPTTALATGGTASGAVPAALSASPSVVAPATGGSMGALNWLSLASDVGGKVVGTYLQNKANNKATDAESKAAADALAFEKQIYADRTQQLEPYRNLGAASIGKLSDLLGISLPKVNPAPMATDPNHIQNGQSFPASWVPGNPANSQSVGAQLGVPPPTAQNADTVLVQAPDGSKRPVPSSLATFYVARGGTLV